MAPPEQLADFTVLIIGGGIAGLSLAMLLERAGIQFQVYERAATVRPLGSAVALGPNVLPMFEQMGILDDFVAMAKENNVVSNFNEDLEQTSFIDYTTLPERTGYANYCIARTHLYDLLYSQVPREKIHLGKKLASFQQQDQAEPGKKSVIATFTDGSTAEGDIIVGADGAYSSVRQSLFQQLNEAGKLPEADKEELSCSSICLVGQTRPLSREKFVYLKDPHCRFENIAGKNKPYTWLTFTMPDDTICWMVIHHLHDITSRSVLQHNVEWGPGSADVMIEASREFPIPSGDGLKMDDLINETPREAISQVALEGKFFETWSSGRAVLVGDACHKMYPSAGQGANTSIQDAIVLANYLYFMKDKSLGSITSAFELYHQEREAPARTSYDTSDNLRMALRRPLVRWLMRYTPQFVWHRILDRFYANRPQVAFLPLAPTRGSLEPLAQKSLGLSASLDSHVGKVGSA